MKRPLISIKDIDLIVYDFDGVFTDNKVIVFEDGKEAVICNRSDGLAVSEIKKLGIQQAILSTEKNKVVQQRAKKLEIKAMQGVDDKKSALLKYCLNKKINLKRVLYIGNDINDFEVMQVVGWPMCPQDAHQRIKKISRRVFSKNGGEGVVQELADFIAYE